MIREDVAIVPALTDEQILATRDVKRQLRPCQGKVEMGSSALLVQDSRLNHSPAEMF